MGVVSLFNSKPSKGTTGNSGNAGRGGWTLTGTASGNDMRRIKAARRDAAAPRGSAGRTSTRRPQQ